MKTNRHKIKITLQTPLTIGNDKSDQLSPLCDFIIKGREVIYIDPDKLGRMVLEKGLMDEFIRESRQVSNTRTNFQLEQFIKNGLGTDPEKLMLNKFQIRGRPDRRMYIRPMLKSGGKPYIPGSSIKGAVKTAILYNWLSSSGTGKSKLTAIIGKIRSSNTPDRQLALTIKISLDELVSDLFGKLTARGDSHHDFFCLQFSDSELLSSEDMVISEVSRLHLVKTNLGIPQYLETLQERTSSDFDLTLVPVIKHRDLDFLNHGIENLWSVLNNFSKKSVDTDWDILDSHADKFDKDDESRNIYNALFDFYEKLSGKIGSDRKIAYLRLGFGKTYFDNSLGLAIYDESPDIFMKYVKLLSLGKPRQKEFPVTRTVCTNPLIPMGWTTLQF